MDARSIVIVVAAAMVATVFVVLQLVGVERKASLDSMCRQLVTIYDGNHLGTELRMGEPNIRPERGAVSIAAKEIKRLHPECVGHLD